MQPTGSEGKAASPKAVSGATAKVVRLEELTKAASPMTPMVFHISTDENSKSVQGRRAFFQYRDTGLTRASNGRVRAQVTTCTAAMDRETGWHYHLCETQIGYIIKGWADLEFEDGTEVRVKTGDVLLVPGGFRHNELRTSEDFMSLDMSIPADMGTVPCAMPDGWTSRKAAK